jgi:SSS family solute:Na+ symporter
VATIVISLLTGRKKSDDDLRGLVYALTPRLTDRELKWYARPATLGVLVLGLTLVLNLIFW